MLTDNVISSSSKQLENVAIALITTPRQVWVAEPIHCRIIAFLLLIHYFMLWPWLWPSCLTLIKTGKHVSIYTSNKLAKFHGNFTLQNAFHAFCISLCILTENIAESFKGLLFLTHTVHVCPARMLCHLVCVLHTNALQPSQFTIWMSQVNSLPHWFTFSAALQMGMVNSAF